MPNGILWSLFLEPMALYGVSYSDICTQYYLLPAHFTKHVLTIILGLMTWFAVFHVAICRQHHLKPALPTEQQVVTFILGHMT